MGRIGFSRFSEEMAREWPWFARMRYCKGSESVAVVSVGDRFTGTMAKRCFSFVATMDWSSWNVRERAWTLRQAS